MHIEGQPAVLSVAWRGLPSAAGDHGVEVSLQSGDVGGLVTGSLGLCAADVGGEFSVVRRLLQRMGEAALIIVTDPAASG
jgi:hypothetical protein